MVIGIYEGGISYEDCFVPRESNDRKFQVASVVEADVKTIDGNSTGQATAGFVRIRGHVAHYTWTDWKGALYLTIAADITETTTKSSCKDDKVPVSQVVPSPLWVAILFDDPGDAARRSESLYFLAQFVVEEDVQNMVHAHGFIVKRMAEDGAYARLGTFHPSGEEGPKRCCSWPKEIITLV